VDGVEEEGGEVCEECGEEEFGEEDWGKVKKRREKGDLYDIVRYEMYRWLGNLPI
jgi:hypothetical protein